MNALSLAAVAAGGAIGAMARFAIAQWVMTWNLASFRPFDTLLATALVNVAGSFFMGIAYVLIVEQSHNNALPLREFWMVGCLGAFTTFSTFALESLGLIHQGLWLWAGLYAVLSAMACTLSVALGIAFVKVLA